MLTLFLAIINTYLVINVLYLFISAVAGRLGKADDSPIANETYRRMAVLIPAYKEDSVILDSVEANLKQTYPKTCFDLIVIADSFHSETLARLRQYPIKVIDVKFEQSTVQKSITHALNTLSEDAYDAIVIADADNHMAPDFLARINQAFADGWSAVQGHRVAKNTNTRVAIFDAINEEVNNNLFRAGQRALGLSASLIGSGMGFDLTIVKKAMNQIKTVSGYDKELEMLLLCRGVKIGYLDKALIFDEKVQNLTVFESQRTRWLAAQLYFVRAYFKTGVQQLLCRNVHSFNTFIKSLLLPRTLLLATLFVVTTAQWLLASSAFALSIGLSILLVFSLSLSVPLHLWKQLSWRDGLTLIRLMFSMVRSLLNFRRAGKKFIHTPHGIAVDQAESATNYEFR